MIIVTIAMRPLEGSFSENALRHNLAGLNIEGSRIGVEEYVIRGGGGGAGTGWGKKNEINVSRIGRFPANVILNAADEILAEFPLSDAGIERQPRGTGGIWSGESNAPCGPQYGDTGSAARFFKQVKP